MATWPTPLTSNVAIHDIINPPQTWKWYKLSLADEFNGTTTLYNVVVSLDSEELVSDAGEDVWATFDLLVVNGTAPGNADNGLPNEDGEFGNPYCWIEYECPTTTKLAFDEKARVTASFGFNHTAPGGMLPPLTDVVIGVRHEGLGPAAFSLKATRLPRVLVDDTVVESAVAPCAGDDEMSCRQFFSVPVSGYDIVHLVLERTGDNLTYANGDPDGPPLLSNGGRGLVGDFYVATEETFFTPPPQAFDVARMIDNVTHSVEAEYFCTLPSQAGTYTVAVVAGTEANGGFGAELMTSAAEIQIDAGVSRQGRGRFKLHVRHSQFKDGEMYAPHDSRPGCVSYGQTRNYTLTSTGMGDSNLYAHVGGANVSAMRARCDGCDWVEATPPISALSASPCHMRNGTTWELQVTLAEYVPATLAGLAQAEFVLSTELQNASVFGGEVVEPRGLGGRGYVCCGAVHTYVVPDVLASQAVSIKLNVTMGHLRTAFLKYDQCADPTDDVVGAACTGLCEISWLTVYDEFYGSMQHTQASALSVPFGPEAWVFNPETTNRRGGDWYISLQALPGIAAEYRMEVELLEPPRAPDVYSCTRFAGFCPKNHYSGGYHHSGSIEVTVSESSGVPSCSGSPLLALSVCLVASVARRALSSLMW